MRRAEPEKVRSVSTAEMACAAIVEAQVARLQAAVGEFGHSGNGKPFARQWFLLGLSGAADVDQRRSYGDLLVRIT